MQALEITAVMKHLTQWILLLTLNVLLMSSTQTLITRKCMKAFINNHLSGKIVKTQCLQSTKSIHLSKWVDHNQLIKENVEPEAT